MTTSKTYNTPLVHTRKLGKFNLTWELIDNSPEIVKELLSKMIIIRAESMLESRTIAYTAICDDFEYIPLGHEIPIYNIQIESQWKAIVKRQNSGIRKLILVPNKKEQHEMRNL